MFLTEVLPHLPAKHRLLQKTIDLKGIRVTVGLASQNSLTKNVPALMGKNPVIHIVKGPVLLTENNPETLIEGAAIQTRGILEIETGKRAAIQTGGDPMIQTEKNPVIPTEKLVTRREINRTVLSTEKDFLKTLQKTLPPKGVEVKIERCRLDHLKRERNPQILQTQRPPQAGIASDNILWTIPMVTEVLQVQKSFLAIVLTVPQPLTQVSEVLITRPVIVA
jgi:hypothetical protein